MAKETTYAGTLGDWRRLLEPLEVNSAELTHLEGSRAKLDALWTQAVEINKQQAARAAAKQEATQQLKVMVTEGRRLATLLRQAVKEHYGIRSEKLAEFGVQPFRGRTRKVKPTTEGPTAPNPTPTPPPITPAAPASPGS